MVSQRNGVFGDRQGTIYHNIGGILHAQGNFAAAEDPVRKAWDISRRLLGENNPRTMLDAVAYAAVLEKRLAPDHPYLTLARENLQNAILSLTAQARHVSEK